MSANVLRRNTVARPTGDDWLRLDDRSAFAQLFACLVRSHFACARPLLHKVRHKERCVALCPTRRRRHSLLRQCFVFRVIGRSGERAVNQKNSCVARTRLTWLAGVVRVRRETPQTLPFQELLPTRRRRCHHRLAHVCRRRGRC